MRRVHLYHLSVDPLLRAHRIALKQSFFKLLWKGRSPKARRQVCYQRPLNGGLRMPDLESHWLAERLAYLGRSLSRDTVWEQKVNVAFPHLESSPKAEGRRQPRDEASRSDSAGRWGRFALNGRQVRAS